MMNKDLFVNEYLKRIKFHGDISIDIYTLKKIQKQHLLTIPFENLNIFSNERINFDTDKIWSKIVKNKRGGICYELNGLLFHLLKEIGFDVKYIGAKVLDDGNEFDHVFLSVNLNEEEWLIDVGFGDNFLEPLKVIINEIQKDTKGKFKIIIGEEDEYKLLKSVDESDYLLEYTFTLKERKLDDFKERCLFFETSTESMFRKNRICSIEKEDGRISLSDEKLTVTKNGEKLMKKINNEDEFIHNLKSIFNIE